MKPCRIAAVGGDGIGPEVIEAGLEILTPVARLEAGFECAIERSDWDPTIGVGPAG